MSPKAPGGPIDPFHDIDPIKCVGGFGRGRARGLTFCHASVRTTGVGTRPDAAELLEVGGLVVPAPEGKDDIIVH